MSKALVIYHGNCADGFGAAWVARKFYGEQAEFHAGVYGQEPPDVTDRNVVLVDFSYKRSVLIEMATKANSILIIDHHKTAQEDLKDLPANVQAYFDMEHSGAMLTWMHFFPNVEPPTLIKHIEDRDLWRFKLPGTREIQAAVFSYPYDFEVWDNLMSLHTGVLHQEGGAIERKHFKDIKELLPIITRKMKIAGFVVDVANLPYIFSSDAGHDLAKREGNAFGACYYDTPEGRIFSLRSIDTKEDVGAIAKQYGGGGHRNAAGFKVDYNTARTMEEV